MNLSESDCRSRRRPEGSDDKKASNNLDKASGFAKSSDMGRTNSVLDHEDAKLAMISASKQVKDYLARIGKKGGKVSSKAKTAAAKRNARRPRPRKGTK